MLMPEDHEDPEEDLHHLLGMVIQSYSQKTRHVLIFSLG